MNPREDDPKPQVQPPIGQSAGQVSSATVQHSPANVAPNQPKQGVSSENTIQWQASEFVDHQKTKGWFLLCGVGAVVLGAVIYLIAGHNILSTVVVVVAMLTFGIYAGQKPRTLTYALLPGVLKIGTKQYSYDDFKTFNVIQEGVLNGVVLQPLRRFMPPLTLYFAEEDGEKIFDILASHIPHEERAVDPIDNLMRRIRF